MNGLCPKGGSMTGKQPNSINSIDSAKTTGQKTARNVEKYFLHECFFFYFFA